MYTEKGSFGISISHLWTDYWIDFVAWPMISFCSDEPGVTAHICIRSYKTGRSLPHIYIYPKKAKMDPRKDGLERTFLTSMELFDAHVNFQILYINPVILKTIHTNMESHQPEILHHLPSSPSI